MWGFEPMQVDLYLADNADFMQSILVTDPTTGDSISVPEGTEVFFRIGDQRWDGTVVGDQANFKIESEVADTVRRGARVQFCISIGEDDWVLTEGRVIRSAV